MNNKRGKLLKPLISVIVPIYNVEQYLEKCIGSIISQTYRELEIILVDDGSQDSCGNICDEYAGKDERIKVIHKENQGLGFARNSGMDIAIGEYIMFVDSDDFLSENAVECLYERLSADKTDMAVGKFAFSYADGHEDDIYCKWMKDKVIYSEEALKNTQFPVCAWGKLYKKEVFSKLRFSNAACAEDLWAYPYVMSEIKNISVVNELIYHYYQRFNSLVYAKTERTLTSTLRAKTNMAEFLLEKGYKRQARHFYHTAIGTADLFENKEHGKQELFDAISKKKRIKLTGITAHIRWLGIRFPKLYRRIYRFALKILRIIRG